MNPTVNKTVLKNGVKILTKTIPHVRSVSMGIWVNVGARDERIHENGLSHFIEHMLFKGTKKRSAYQLAKEFDAIGGQTNAFTSMENTCFHARVMDTHLSTMADILSDIFLNSEFSEQEVENERPVILSEIGMIEDNPEEYIHTLLEQNLWGKHPLGRSILGSRETVKQFKADAIKQFFHHFYQPDRIIISAAGNVEHNRLLDLIGPSFETIKPGKKLPVRIPPSPQSTVAITQRDIEQVHMCIGTEGISITDKRRFAISLMNTILGGNMSSRLFQEIREKRGLAYSVYSFTSAGVDTGMFGIYVGTSPEMVNTSLDLILSEIRNLKNEYVSQTELQDAKEYTKGNIMLSSESTDNQMVRLTQNEIHFGHYIPLSEIIEKINATTIDDIKNLCTDLFDHIQPAAVFLGPVEDSKQFEEQIHF
ncbi:MAG: insulinase family protein [Proteobacteria bacterium]|nr:insulinase family protein [Pseudomonadota bacterium]